MYKLGQYISGESIIHKIDPRVKVLSVIGLSAMILAGSTTSLFLYSCLLVMTIAISQIHFVRVMTALRPMLFFLCLLFFLHLLLTDGAPIPPFPAWPVTVTSEGLVKGVYVTWQFTLLLISAAMLTMTTSPAALVNGIERLLRPLRIIGVSSHDVAMMISIALRFLPTLLEEIDRMKNAQMARGANFKTGRLLQRARAAFGLLIPVVMNLIRRVEELSQAMEARGYRKGPRTYLMQLHMSKIDYIAIVLMLSIAAATRIIL